MEDTGKYGCTAGNSGGFEQAEVYLHVIGQHVFIFIALTYFALSSMFSSYLLLPLPLFLLFSCLSLFFPDVFLFQLFVFILWVVPLPLTSPHIPPPFFLMVLYLLSSTSSLYSSSSSPTVFSFSFTPVPHSSSCSSLRIIRPSIHHRQIPHHHNQHHHLNRDNKSTQYPQ